MESSDALSEQDLRDIANVLERLALDRNGRLEDERECKVVAAAIAGVRILRTAAGAGVECATTWAVRRGVGHAQEWLMSRERDEWSTASGDAFGMALEDARGCATKYGGRVARIVTLVEDEPQL